MVEQLKIRRPLFAPKPLKQELEFDEDWNELTEVSIKEFNIEATESY